MQEIWDPRSLEVSWQGSGDSVNVLWLPEKLKATASSAATSPLPNLWTPGETKDCMVPCTGPGWCMRLPCGPE